jgi:hypothetical protein
MADLYYILLIKHPQSNVVVTGVPTKNYRLPSEWIQPHTTIVNVASFKNVNEDEILQIEGVQYVPMVGKVTGGSRTNCLLLALSSS